MLDGMSFYLEWDLASGFESLIIPAHPETQRSAKAMAGRRTFNPVYIGLEAVEDLIQDLEAGLNRCRPLHDNIHENFERAMPRLLVLSVWD